MAELDTSKPIRGVSATEALVRHVLASDEKNESDWLEWKSGLDLSAAPGRFAAAKHILGFANRSPDRAAVNAGGCAYLVLGAEPGGVLGQAPMDPADIVSGIRGYVGDDGPAWSPMWVSVDDENVLVLTVEPPSWGDSIHALRKTHGSFQAGAVFVRHPGSTDPASPDDLRMLERRLLAKPADPLEIIVEVVGDSPAPIDISEPAIEGWVEAKRAQLLAPLVAEEKQAARDAAGTTEVAIAKSKLPPGIAIHAAESERLRKVLDSVGSSLGGLAKAEPRSADEYRSEVDVYIDECRQRLGNVVIAGYVRSVDDDDDVEGMLALTVRNPSARHVRDLELDVTFEGPVLSFDEVPEVLPLPKEPRRWGPIADDRLASMMRLSTALNPAWTMAPVSLPRGFTTRNHGSTTVSFDGIHLRPRKSYELPSVPLVIGAEPGTVITATWDATSTDFDGVCTGTFAFEVTEPALQPLDLLPVDDEG